MKKKILGVLMVGIPLLGIAIAECAKHGIGMGVTIIALSLAIGATIAGGVFILTK